MTDDMELTRPIADDVLDRARIDGDGRTVTLRLMAWDEVAQTPQGRETFRRGAFAGTDPTTVLIESERHDGAIVGAGQAIEERDDGAYLVARVSDTAAGRDLLTLLADRVLRSASATFVPITSSRRPDGVIQRDRVELRRVAILPRGAYRSAGVLAVRAEVPGMIPNAPDPIPEPTPTPDPPDWSPVLTRLSAQDDAIARLAVQLAGGAGGAGRVTELSRFDSLGEAFMASTADPAVRRELHRALADQTFVGNVGLGWDGWINEVKGIIPGSRPAIAAFGGAAALPANGMSLVFPRAIKPISEPIGVQPNEKAPITSVAVGFDQGGGPIATYAGGSDVSYQLLKRSEPPYRDLYARQMLAAYARVTDNAFVDALATDGTGTATWDALADTTGAAFVALLFAESVKVETETGAPADAVVCATDVFLEVAGKSLIVPTNTSTATALGNATASTLRLAVSGLTIVHDRNLAAGKFVIGNSLAARWHEDGPYTVEAEDVEKLGRNIAYWGLGAPGIYIPAGIIVGTMTTVVGATGRTRKD